MKAYLKFAVSFWMRAFATMGSMGGARSGSRAKKNAGVSASPVPLL
jgi:hypothetical protein